MSQERFRKDQRVIFRKVKDFRWFSGRVTDVNFNLGGEAESYVVQEWDQIIEPKANYRNVSEIQPGDSYTIPCGHENIRIFPSEKLIMKRLSEACYTPPLFSDPYSHLYMGSGEINLPSKEEVEGLIGYDNLRFMAVCVSNRNKMVEGPVNILQANPSKALSSILPNVREVEVLEEMARTNVSAVLQLADVYQFGLLGAQTNESRSVELYLAAAHGLNTEEMKGRNYSPPCFSYPIGTPKALTAVAHGLWNLVCQKYQLFGSDEEKHVKFHEALKTMDELMTNIVRMVVHFLAHSIRRGWMSPLSMEIGRYLYIHNLVDNFFPDSMQLMSVLDWMKAREDIVPHGENAADCFSVPSQYQMECFAPKASEIFLGLPIRATHEGFPTTIHVEYREMPFPPYQIVMMAINPHTNKKFGFMPIPSELELVPYSKDTMEYLWGCVVFNSMHRGDFRDGLRFRPSTITFADKPGDRLFAEYVKTKIGGEACGTKIKLINTATYKVRNNNFVKEVSIRMIQHRLEKKISQGLEDQMSGLGLREKPFDLRTSCDEASTSFNERTNISVDDLCAKIEGLEQKGNGFFQNGRLRPALRCYTEAIDLIQINANLNDTIFIVLGKLLSHRAVCLLKMAETMSSDSARTALEESLADCENGLKSKSLARVMPSGIKKGLETTEESATIQLWRLKSQPSDVTPHYDLERSQVAPQSLVQPTQMSRNRRKKATKKQKQKQKRRQRRQRVRKQGPQNGGEVTEETDRELVSIATGNDLFETKITPFVTGREDTCPCCFDRFSVELDSVFCLVNPCGHAYCLPCISELKKKSQKGSNPIGFNCPVCRIPIQKDILNDAVDPILSCTPCLQDRIVSLPLQEIEGKQVVKELCLRHDFKIPTVLSALDVMLTDGLQASLRSSKNLNSAQKQEIYEMARAPVDVLWAEAKELRSQMHRAYDLESETYQTWKDRLVELQTSLIPAATKTAVDFIWEKMNSAGSMGIENDSSGEIEIDFHALFVHEAKERFLERVVPILPAVKSTLLVVGRGNHSKGGEAKLKAALKKLIENHSKMRYSHVEGNDGILRVRWVH